MGHSWHKSDIDGCLQHAESFSRSAMGVLSGNHINSDMQAALHSDIKEVLEDIVHAQLLNRGEGGVLETYRPGYVQYLEGVVFVQLHQIQQLQKEVARHVAPA